MNALLAILIALDVIIRVWFWYLQSRKSPPLSSFEFHLFNGDNKEELKRFIDECNKETRQFVFEEIRRKEKRDFDSSLNSQKRSKDD